MSLRISIQTELKGINDVVFHYLCNALLAREHRVELHSPGIATAKDKPRPGQPDAFFPLRNSKYVLAEYTTQDSERRSDFLAKLESDLRHCLDFPKLGITPAQVDRIILCCNSAVSLGEREDLEKLVRPYGIRLSIYDIDELARVLEFEGRSIAKVYLRVPISAGYLLTRCEFVAQYQRGRVATPLDTPWVGRSGQVERMAARLQEKDILVVKGQQGIGKTRLVLEVITYFVQQHPEYEAFFVLNNAQSIEEDLAIHLRPGKHYLFFLDDVNQHPSNLMVCINKLTQGAYARIKIVTTVRDYAKTGVIECVRAMNFEEVPVARMDNDALTELVLVACGNIRSQVLMDRLLTISAGNPRLALMAAESIRTSPDIEVLQDAGSIWARYFDPIVSGNALLQRSVVSKALGLIALFYTLDIEDPHDLQILATFGFDTDVFMDTVRELEALEFVDIQDGCVVKIAEQTMATYFFYKAFFQDRSLPFSAILTGYFASHWWQMRDGFVPAQAIFGSEKVLDPVRESLLAYYRSIRTTPSTCDRFLEVFGRYFPNEVFRYLLEETELIAEAPDCSLVSRPIGRGPVYYDNHMLLKLLEVHFESTDKRTLEAAVDLGFRLVRKLPQLYEALVRKWQQALPVSPHEPGSIKRLGIVFDWMEARRADSRVIQPAFYAIFRRLLVGSHIEIGFFFDSGRGVRVDPSIGQYRARCWEALLQDMSACRDVIFQQLMDYLDDEQYLRPVLISFDLPYLKRLISTGLDPAIFGHCYFVNLLEIVVKEKVKDERELYSLCEPFKTGTWKQFLLYGDDSFLRGRERVPFDHYEKAQLAKAKKVRSSIKDGTAKEYRLIHEQLEVMSTFADGNRFTLGWANDIALSEIAQRNLTGGYKALRYYAKRGNRLHYFPTQVLQVFFAAGPDWTHKVWKLIDKSPFPDKFKWIESYFLRLPDEYIDVGTIRQLRKHYQSTPAGHTLFEGTLDRFLGAAPSIYSTILIVLSEKRATDESFVFHLGYRFFQQLAGNHIPTSVCKQAYLQQQRMPGHYDSDSSEFFALFDRDPMFLRELVMFLVEEPGLRLKTDYRPLGKIWDYPAAEEIIAPIFQDLLAHKDKWCSRDVAVTIFFGMNANHQKRAATFLQRMLREHPASDVLYNWVFEIARSYLREQYIPLLLYALRQNPDLERFKKMGLLSSSFMTSSNEIWEEVRAKELRNIQNEISNDLERITYMGHLDYLTEWINQEQKVVKRTKRNRFRKFEH